MADYLTYDNFVKVFAKEQRLSVEQARIQADSHKAFQDELQKRNKFNNHGFSSSSYPKAFHRPTNYDHIKVGTKSMMVSNNKLSYFNTPNTRSFNITKYPLSNYSEYGLVDNPANVRKFIALGTSGDNTSLLGRPVQQQGRINALSLSQVSKIEDTMIKAIKPVI